MVDPTGRRDAKRANSLLELRRQKLEFGEAWKLKLMGHNTREEEARKRKGSRNK